MDLRYTLSFKTPLGFKLRIIVDEKEIQDLINRNYLMPWNYKLIIYGCDPKVYEFRYWIDDYHFMLYLKIEYYRFLDYKVFPYDK